jgi:hypothetical protein
VEITDLPIVKNKAVRWCVECLLLMEHVLLETAGLVLIRFVSDGSVGFAVGDGLEEPISNGLEESGTQIWLGLEGCLDGAG